MGRGDEAAAAVDRAIAPRFDRWFYCNRAKTHLVGRNDVAAAIRAHFDLHVIENDADFLAQNVGQFADGNHQQRVVELARLHDCGPTIRGRWITIVETVAREGDQSAPAATLTAQLERMFVAVRNAGADSVMSCHSWPHASIEVLRAAAEEHDVPFCDVESEFAVRTAGRPRRSLQAPDGHCNDAGYAIMTDTTPSAWCHRCVPLAAEVDSGVDRRRAGCRRVAGRVTAVADSAMIQPPMARQLRVELTFLSTLQQVAGRGTLWLELPQGATVDRALALLRERYPQFQGVEVLASVNGMPANGRQVLAAGDGLFLLPPG